MIEYGMNWREGGISMPRMVRKMDRANYNHIILRGISEVPVFSDDEDRQRFLDQLAECAGEYDIEVHAYCLMKDHIHLLICVRNDCMSSFVQKLASRYVSYYNYKYSRRGSLFQGRFRHEPIRSPEYYLSVLRYIHRDPENSNIGAVDSFKWSSYGEYEAGSKKTGSRIVVTGPALELLGGFENFCKFLACEDDIIGMDVDNNSEESDERIAIFVSRCLNIKTPRAINGMSIKSRNMLIREMRALGITASQISRLTGVSRSVIYKLEY